MRLARHDLRAGLLVVILSVTAGCGGGSNGQGPEAPPATTGSLSAGVHVLSLSVAAPEAQVPVSGISVAFVLPQGLAVATTDSGAGRIVESALVAGDAVGGQNLVSGSFSPATRVVRLSMATVPSVAWSGEFARLTVTVLPGATVRPADIEALGTSLQQHKVVGVEPTRRATVTVTDRSRISFRVVEP